jgi:uncharacterized damage-inducible protein DinB
MEQVYIDYLDRLESLHNNLKAVLNDLDQQALDWSPGEDMNSICVLAIHVAGAQRYWIGDVLAGQPSGRDRAAEFSSHGLTASDLVSRLDESMAYVRSVLEDLTMEDLHQMRLVPRDRRQVSVSYALAHVLAHTGLHAGHAQLTRQFLEVR